jgi:hypothetical protein
MAKRKRDGDAPKSDVYVGLLALALLAQIVAAVFLFLDYNNLGSVKLPSMPKFTWSGEAPAAAAPAGAAPAGGAPGGAAPAGN